MPEDEFDKSFSTLISKLGHPVEEIRLRALENLQAKLNLKLISDVDILQYKYLYIKLLEWFNFPSPPKRDVVLQILLKLSKVKEIFREVDRSFDFCLKFSERICGLSFAFDWCSEFFQFTSY